MVHSRKILLALAFLVWAASPGWAASPLKATPASMTFTYQVGGATMPAPLTLAVSSTPSGISFTAAISGAPWLTVSQSSGTAPLSLKVSANPTSLTTGSYTTAIVLTPTSGTNTDTLSIPVTLTVKAPPAVLTVTPSPLTVNYQLGNADPSGLALSISTNSVLTSYSATSSGGTWLSLGASGGIAFPGFPSSLRVNVVASNLAPGAYKGAITITSTGAANPTQSITVNLTVNPATPTVTSVWPPTVISGSGDTTVTIEGSGFYKGSVVTAGATALASTFVGATVMTAIIPTASLTTPGSLPIIVTNTPGGSSTPFDLTISPPGPTITAVADAASFISGAVAPGEMVNIFGSALGPDPLATFTPPASGLPIDTTLSGVQVFFDTFPAPLIYVSSTQLAVMVPYEIAGQIATLVHVVYKTNASNVVSVNVATAAPAVFTFGGGSGQAAACNIDSTTGLWSINSASAPAPKGSIIVFYATGQGVTTPASTDGEIPTDASPAPYDPTITAQIGGAAATVQYVGYAPGIVAGVMQVQVVIPTTIATSQTSPLILTIGTVNSQAGVTVSVK